MANNMDEFLRRAAERRLQRAKRPDAQSAPPQQPIAPPPRSVPPRQLERQSPPQFDQQPPRAQAELPQRQLGKKQSPQKQRSQPKQTLAQKIEKADDQMRSHLQSAFSHPVGNLGTNRQGTSGPVTRSPKGDAPVVQAINPNVDLPLGQQIIEALKDPQQTKIAFIASEIFQRRF